MSSLQTLGRDELMQAIGDYMAKKAGCAVKIHGLTTTFDVNANPQNPSITVEFTEHPHEDDAPDLDFAPDPTNGLP